MGPVTHLGYERVLGWVLEKRVLPEEVPLYLGKSLLKLTGILLKLTGNLKCTSSSTMRNSGSTACV